MGSFVERSLSLRACIGTMNVSNAVGARLCEPQRVATAPSSAGHRPALRDGRFMESAPLHFLHPRPPRTTLFPYTTLFRSQRSRKDDSVGDFPGVLARAIRCDRSEEQTCELPSHSGRAWGRSWKDLFRFAHALEP